MPSAIKFKQHFFVVYIIKFHFIYAIINLAKLLLVKTTSKQKYQRKKGIQAKLGLPDGIAKRWLGDSS